MLIDDFGGFLALLYIHFCWIVDDIYVYYLNYSLSKDHILRHYLRLLRRLLIQLLTHQRFEPVLHRRHR